MYKINLERNIKGKFFVLIIDKSSQGRKFFVAVHRLSQNSFDFQHLVSW
jgi:hypothetical protein